MNLIYLSHYLYSKEKVQECLLLVQLTCMILFALVVLAPVDTLLQQYSSLQKIYRYNLSDFCHVSAGNAVMQNNRVDSSAADKLYDTLRTLDGVEAVFRFSLQQVGYETVPKDRAEHQHKNESNWIANLFVYSGDMAKFVAWDIAEGEFLSYYDDTLLPVVVSPSLIDDFPIGSRMTVRVGEKETPVLCIVTGVLSANCFIPTIYGYGSVPSMDVLVTRCSNMENSGFIVTSYNEELLKTVRWEPNYLIELQNKDDLSGSVQVLDKIVGTYGTVKPVPELINQSVNALLKDRRWDILAFALLTVIALYGFGGYTFLMIRRRQNKLALFRILGMQQIHIVITISIAEILLLLLSSIGACVIFPWFTQRILLETYSRPGIISILFCGSLFLLLLIVSIWTGFQQSSKATEAALYNGGD